MIHLHADLGEQGPRYAFQNGRHNVAEEKDFIKATPGKIPYRIMFRIILNFSTARRACG
jgi:hypothetical protein